MKYYSQFLICLISLSSCKSIKTNQNSLAPKIENHTQGELIIKVAPFGLGANEIVVGQITTEGTVHFNWPEIDTSSIEGIDFYLESIQRSVGMHFCSEKLIEKTNEVSKAIDTKHLNLYKKDQYVGTLFPATNEKLRDNESLNRQTTLKLGSHVTWIYSDGEAIFIANCSINTEYEDCYNFIEQTNYDINFKKGWNPVLISLEDKEDWNNGTKQGSLPKIISKVSIKNIPLNINWYINYFGN